MQFTEFYKNLPNAEFSSVCNILDIQKAERALQVKFPIEYVDMLLQTGAIKCSKITICGVGVGSAHNVVDQTIQQRTKHNIPKNCIVLERPSSDGIVLLLNETGEVVEFDNGKIKKLADTLSDYIMKIYSDIVF